MSMIALEPSSLSSSVNSLYYGNESTTEPYSPWDKETLVKLARRKRSNNTRRNSAKTKQTFKAQGRPLAAQTKIRFSLVQDLKALYRELVPGPHRKSIELLKIGKNGDIEDTLNEVQKIDNPSKTQLQIKPLLFVENVPNRKSLTRAENVTTYSTIDEAMETLFGLKEYTLLRVTRAAATEPGGTLLLKVESAMPGNKHLNDDEYDDSTDPHDIQLQFDADNLLGSVGDRPTTTFLKKKVARPRYKAGMRIYVLPKVANVVMYFEERMLKRDLLKGVLNIAEDERSILCCFDASTVLSEVDKLNYQRRATISGYHYQMPQLMSDQDLEQEPQIFSHISHSQSLPDLKFMQHLRQPLLSLIEDSSVKVKTESLEQEILQTVSLEHEEDGAESEDIPSSAATTDFIQQATFFENEKFFNMQQNQANIMMLAGDSPELHHPEVFNQLYSMFHQLPPAPPVSVYVQNPNGLGISLNGNQNFSQLDNDGTYHLQNSSSPMDLTMSLQMLQNNQQQQQHHHQQQQQQMYNGNNSGFNFFTFGE